MRKELHRVHKLIGLSLALLLMVQGLTGAALVFRDPLLVGLNHELLATAPPVAVPAVGRILKEVDATFGTPVVDRVVFPRGTRTAAMVWVVTDQALTERVIASDPVSGRVLGEITGVRLLPFLLFRLHDEFMLGMVGHVVGLVESLGLVFLGVSGLVLARPQKAIAWRVRWRAPRPLRYFDLHRVTGLVFAPLLVLWALMGILLQADVLLSPPPAFVQARVSARNWSVLDAPVQELSRRYPAQAIEDLRLSPDQDRATVALYTTAVARPLALDHATIDLATGKVVEFQQAARDTSGASFLEWMYPLHSGKAFGVYRAPLSILGVGLFLLPVLGVSLWLARRRASARARASLAPFAPHHPPDAKRPT